MRHLSRRRRIAPSFLAPPLKTGMGAARLVRWLTGMLRGLSLLLAVSAGGWSHAAPLWTAQVDPQTGLPFISKGGVRSVGANWAFWGADWSWADFSARANPAGQAMSYNVQGQSKRLELVLQAPIEAPSSAAGSTVWKWRLAFDAAKALDPVIGGGLAFKFDLDAFGAEMGEPRLLPEAAGWAWGKPGGPRIELRFEPALRSVHFERGNRNEIRAYFYEGRIPSGVQRTQMSLTLSGGVEAAVHASERYGPDRPQNWPLDNTDWASAPIDLSFLNQEDKPAGKRGFVRAEGDQLVFGDGTPARFWGTNVNAYALFETPRDAVRVQARRLAQLGFNLVRIHHHDAHWVDRNIFGNMRSLTDTRRIDEEAFDKIGWWVKCLSEEGIHIWLDLHAHRKFKPGDGIEAFEETAKEDAGRGDPKGYGYVNATIQDAMKRFAQEYVTRVNPHTGLAFKDDPAVVAMLITNENDITSHFGNSLLPDKKVPQHSRRYMAAAEAFAKASGLPEDQVWRSWEHGPSKVFLNDLEQRMAADMLAHLRGLGVKVPVATTNTWGGNALSSLPALTAGSLVDVHAYAPQGQLQRSPLAGPSLAHWLGAGQVLGLPMTVTEWNAEPFPTADRHTLPMYIGAVAAHQGWDALMHFAYTQSAIDGPGRASNWASYNDPSIQAPLAAAALMYRRGDVKPAQTRYVLDPGAALFNQNLSPVTSVALRTAMERGRLEVAMPETPALKWLKRIAPPAGTNVVRDPNQALLPADATAVTTDTGQLTRDWAQGVYRIDTPRTQAAMGWLGGKPIALPQVELNLQTANATVAVQSLDGKPIAASRRLLVTLAARSQPQSGDRAPFHAEPVRGQLQIQAPAGLKVFKRAGGAGASDEPVAFEWRDGRYQINLDDKLRANWLVLRP
jgi:hypothetical protein